MGNTTGYITGNTAAAAAHHAKPRLLVAVDTYYPKMDGTLKFVEEFAKRASDTFDLTILAPDFGVRHRNAQEILLPVSRILKSSGYSSIKISWGNIRRIKDAVKYSDLVFVQGPALISFLAVIFARLYGRKSIGYMHINVWDFFRNFLNTLPTKIAYVFFIPLIRWNINNLSLILIPYQELEEELRRRHIHTPVQVARLGVDINLFSPPYHKAEWKRRAGIEENRPVIGYVGRISKEKNIAVLLAAFRKLRNPQTVLLLVGGGDEGQMKELRRIPGCIVTGFVGKVQEYLKAMDVFVMPSLTETTSLATLEAMATGIPVVVTKVGFMKNYVVKGHNGLFFPRNSSALLSIKINKLLRDTALCQKLGSNARKTVAYSFSWERSINRIKRILKAYATRE